MRRIKYISLFKKILYRYRKQKNVSISLHSKVSMDSIFEQNTKVYGHSLIVSSQIGFMTYVGSYCNIAFTKIGRFSSIGNRVCVIRGRHPSNTFVSTHPSFFSIDNPSTISLVRSNKFNEFKFLDFENKICIEIGSDCWIGDDVKIIEGVKIGDGAIIGTGALVTKDIPPFAIAVGVPAKIIKYRFTEEQIKRLLSLKWWEKDFEYIKEHSDYFENIDLFLANSN